MQYSYQLSDQNKIKGSKIAGYAFLRALCLVMIVGLIGLFVFEAIFVSIYSVQELEFESVGEMIVVNLVFFAFWLFFLVVYLWSVNAKLYLFPDLGLIVRINFLGMRKEISVNFAEVFAVIPPSTNGKMGAILHYRGKVIARTFPTVADNLPEQLSALGIDKIIFQ